ncbi:MAG TPA: hypothetical protein VI076_09855 [Actinopolymorphaceae bacterium]
MWRLWAITQDLPYPAFGPTSVLDADSPRLPEGIDATAADVAEPPPMSAWVRRRPGAP